MDGIATFNYDDHKARYVEAYKVIYPQYEEFCVILKNLLTTCIKNKNLKVNSIETRAKDPISFGEKAITPSENDPNTPKYSDPLAQITDLAGVRIITYFLNTIKEVEIIIKSEFDIIEKIDKTAELLEKDKFGYQSVHYLVKFSQKRTELSEYKKYSSLIAEIQIRTILQHAWAEIEHDIQYKSDIAMPIMIKRRFSSLASLIEIADREFQSIQIEDDKINNLDKKNIKNGLFEKVPINARSIKYYLDEKIGSDGRVSDFSYSWITKILIELGFHTIKQVDECIGSYDDDKLSNIVFSNRQGQLTRFELMLLAGMGENFIKLHRWNNLGWFIEYKTTYLEKMKKSSISIGSYLPSK